jgi:putative SOS response-associated peptidase YedK
MTVILAEEHREAWLNNQAGKEVLVPFPATAMRALAYQSERKQSKRITIRIYSYRSTE